MNVTANIATLVLFTFYAVSFTKPLVGRLSADPATSTAVIRLWALVLGLAGAVGDYLLTSHAYDRAGLYTEIKLGAAAAVGAILTYHIGSAAFRDAFDVPTPGEPTVVTASHLPDTIAVPGPVSATPMVTAVPPPPVA